MNEITTIPDMDNNKIAALMAELHAVAGPPNNGSDGEATPEEGAYAEGGAFVSEDEASHPVVIN